MSQADAPSAAVRPQAVVGCLLGTAIGDALGLPYEGLSPRRADRIFGPPDRYLFLPSRGMVSDDTEHACMAAQALMIAGDDPRRFARSLAWRLRWWLLGLPGGTGLATAKAILKLWLGFPPHRSGVFSAGNGPAMRGPILGAAITDLRQLREVVRVSTRLTHIDPKAELGAFAVALAARMASDDPNVVPAEYVKRLRTCFEGEPAQDVVGELLELIERAAASADRGESTVEFAAQQGWRNGIGGYVMHTVPASLQAWFLHPREFDSAVQAVIRCGGDADSTAAIVGGIVGCAVGEAGIPEAWREQLWEWPRSIAWMKLLAEQLAASRIALQSANPPRLPIWGVLPRNMFFLAVVLLHGFRRLLPPYA